MSDVLLIDGNPDHVRPLTGLFKYRVKHDLDVVGDCVGGLRRIYSSPPEVILINALLFASEDYGFPRALGEEAAHASIRVIVLISGHLDEIRERAVEQHGASVLELPTSAGELTEAIQTASTLRNRNKEPQAVSWAKADPVEEPEDADQPIVQRVAWQPLTQENQTEDGVRPVSWPVDDGTRKPTGRKPKSRKKRSSSPPAPAPEEKVFKAGTESFQTASFSSGDGFRSMAESVEKVDDQEEKSEPESFQASDFERLSDVDPGSIKNK